MKKSILTVIIIVLAIIAAAVFLLIPNKDIKDNRLILFYKVDCLHCQNVEKYIQDNKIEDKVKFETIEVSDTPTNQDNVNLFVKKALICGISADQIGVPLLWDGQSDNIENSKRCYSGDVDVINFFANKIK